MANITRNIFNDITHNHPFVDNYFSLNEKVLLQSSIFNLKFKDDIKIDYGYLKKLAEDRLATKLSSSAITYKRLSYDMVIESTIYRLASNFFRHSFIIDKQSGTIFYDDFLNKVNPEKIINGQIHRDKLNQKSRLYINTNIAISNVVKNKVYQEINSIFTQKIANGSKSKEMNKFTELYKNRKCDVEKLRGLMKNINTKEELLTAKEVLKELSTNLENSTSELERFVNSGLENIAKSDINLRMLINLNIHENHRLLGVYFDHNEGVLSPSKLLEIKHSCQQFAAADIMVDGVERKIILDNTDYKTSNNTKNSEIEYDGI